MKEKRRFQRGRGDIEWLFVVQITIDDIVVISETKDISASGLKCELEEPLDADQMVDLTFLLPLSKGGLTFEKINCLARVARCESHPNEKNIYSVGFDFQKIKPNVQKKIDQYVKHIEKVQAELS